MADKSGKHLISPLASTTSSFRVQPFQAGPTSTIATIRTGSVGQRIFSPPVSSTTTSLHPRAPGAPVPQSSSISSFHYKSLEEMRAEMGTSVPTATGSLKPTLNPRAFNKVPMPAPRPQLISGDICGGRSVKKGEVFLDASQVAGPSSTKSTLNKGLLTEQTEETTAQLGVINIRNVKKGVVFLDAAQVAGPSSSKSKLDKALITGETGGMTAQLGAIPGGRGVKKGEMVLDAALVAGPNSTKRRLYKGRVGGETEGTLVRLGDFERAVFSQYEHDDDDEEEEGDKAAERRVHFEKSAKEKEAPVPHEDEDWLETYLDLDLELPYELLKPYVTCRRIYECANGVLRGETFRSYEPYTEEELKAMYRANYKVNHSITFGDTAYLLSPRPDPMDLEDKRNVFSLIKFPSTIPVLVADDTAEAGTASASGGVPPMRYANSLDEIPSGKLMGHLRVFKKTRIPKDGDDEDEYDETEEAITSAHLEAEYDMTVKKDALRSGLTRQQWQKKYRLVAKFDFADADAEALKMGSSSSASGGNAAAFSQKMSYNLAIRRNMSTTEVGFLPLSANEQAEIRLAQELMMSQNLSKLEALFRPPPPPSASSTSSSSAAPSLKPAFGAAPAANEGAAASNATRGPRDMMILGRVRNYMTVYATLQPHPADLLPTSSAAGPSAAPGLLALAENAADAEEVPTTMPKLPSLRARRRHRCHQRGKDAAAAAASVAQLLGYGDEAADGATGEVKFDEDVEMAEK